MCNQVKSWTKHGRPNQSRQKETVALSQDLLTNAMIALVIKKIELLNSKQLFFICTLSFLITAHAPIL